MKINDTKRLLIEFESLPKDLKLPTYLEICKYPKRRFEEICSRLLCFYLAPQGEHGLQNLFLFSLLEILAPEKEFHFLNDKIKVISEENAEGKRLDILIYSSSFVIGIENKITASLYNPLEIYNSRIKLYGTENIFRVVLSLKKITNSDEVTYMNANNFVGVTYSEYFKKIKHNLRLFEDNCNKNYLLYLNDFIQTLENMSEKNILNTELSNFFFDNSIQIDQLVELYTKYHNNIDKIQIERVTDLNEKISQLTKTDKWWAWEGWDLGINEFNAQRPKIGIESSYETTKSSPVGIFKIYISAWTLTDWNYYESKILKDFPNKELLRDGNRVYYFVEEIVDDNEELILKSLKKYYEYLKEITFK